MFLHYVFIRIFVIFENLYFTRYGSGGIFNSPVNGNFLQSVTVKEFLISVNIC